MNRRFLLAASAGVVAFCSVASAQELIYGMTAASSSSSSAGVGLVSFMSNAPGVITPIGAFTGVVQGHALREIDMRPADGTLYAVSTGGGTAQIYSVNVTTAALTPIGGTFALGAGDGGILSMDFNPVVDRIRLVSRTGQSYRVNPITGALVAQDTSVAYATGGAPDVIGIAYSNNVPGGVGGVTTLYGWDYNNDALITIGGLNGSPSPNGGQAFPVFTPAGFRTANAGLGMDISGATGIAYVTHDDPTNVVPMSLFSIDLSTGAETLLGAYPQGVFIADIAVAPTPGAAALLGLVGLAGLRRRR